MHLIFFNFSKNFTFSRYRRLKSKFLYERYSPCIFSSCSIDLPPQNSREFSGTGTKFLRCRYRLPVLFSVPNGSHFFLQNGHQGALSLYQYYIKYILISLIDTTNTSSVCNNEYYDDTDQAVLSINIFQGHLHSGLLIAPKTSQE